MTAENDRHRRRGPPAAAEVVLPAGERLAQTVAFFTERLGFRIEAVLPADDPAVSVLSGHGLRLRIERGAGAGGPGALRVPGDTPATLLAPNGTRIEVFAGEPDEPLPPLAPSFVVTRAGDARWASGRAGMLYRDLIPGRQGGRFVASHIRIPEGGPVPDQVHYHEVRFQMIFCRKGWVRLVYEDQGPPFVLEAGDCVLQPPRIRHRVLEASPGLEVIEVGSPARHPTRMDHELALPTGSVVSERDFSGQRFFRHRAADARWEPWRLPGFEARDTGIGAATLGLAGARVARAVARAEPADVVSSPDAELQLGVVLRGRATLRAQAHGAHELGPDDAYVVPAGLPHALSAASADLELLEVTLPAAPATRRHPDLDPASAEAR